MPALLGMRTWGTQAGSSRGRPARCRISCIKSPVSSTLLRGLAAAAGPSGLAGHGMWPAAAAASWQPGGRAAAGSLHASLETSARHHKPEGGSCSNCKAGHAAPCKRKAARRATLFDKNALGTPRLAQTGAAIPVRNAHERPLQRIAGSTKSCRLWPSLQLACASQCSYRFFCVQTYCLRNHSVPVHSHCCSPWHCPYSGT
jgi:hypothetical protein